MPKIFFNTRREVSYWKRACNVLFIIQTPMKFPTISLKYFSAAKGAIYHVAPATVIFSHVKITSYFHAWRYHVFARKLTWYCIGAYIIQRLINKGYYMAVRRYEISSSSVEKYFKSEYSERVNFFQHEKRNLVSPSDHVMFYLLYKHQWNSQPFHLNIFRLRKALSIM